MGVCTIVSSSIANAAGERQALSYAPNEGPFSRSIGFGIRCGNGPGDKLRHRHFLNLVRIVRRMPIPAASEEDLLSDDRLRYGR